MARLRALSPLLLLAAVWAAPEALAADVCEPPIQVCRNGPLPLDTAAGVSSEVVPFPLECPAGYGCVCVPSCPECDDCAAEVCVPQEPECRTACDCEPGLGCFGGQCIAGFAPVFCCDSDVCPAGNQCQHPDGRMDRCKDRCVDRVWKCDTPGASDRACGKDRDCACIASCPDCEDCGGGACVPPNAPTPYRCSDDGSCDDGDRCVCAASSWATTDCADAVCVPDRCEDPRCQERVEKVTKAIQHIVQMTNKCEVASDCTRIDTGTQCRGTCGAWVHKMVAERVEEHIDRLDERICDGFREDGCPFATPACLYEKPACIHNRCTGVPARPGIGDATDFLTPREALEVSR